MFVAAASRGLGLVVHLAAGAMRAVEFDCVRGVAGVVLPVVEIVVVHGVVDLVADIHDATHAAAAVVIHALGVLDSHAAVVARIHAPERVVDLADPVVDPVVHVVLDLVADIHDATHAAGAVVIHVLGVLDSHAAVVLSFRDPVVVRIHVFERVVDLADPVVDNIVALVVAVFVVVVVVAAAYARAI